MQTWIALFRGINVGGNNILPMAKLKSDLESLNLSNEDLLTAIESNPFPNAVSDPKTLHFFFLAEPASNPDTEALGGIKTSTEKYQLTDGVFYLHAPDGVGRSKLAANAEKHLGVVTTARNYRTVAKLLAMVTQN